MKNIIWSTGHQLRFENIVNSHNCFLFDSEGNKYIDLESGVWCTSVGHNNKRINKVIISQINKITHTGFCYAHPQIDESAKKILEITNFENGKCEFLCSGSEAVEYGMRIARGMSMKPLALTFSESYFGAYGDASVKDPKSWYNYNRLDCFCSSPNGCTGDCRKFNEIPFEKIGIFLFEPGSSMGLVRFPSQKLIDKIIERIKENNGIVVVNEITTGIGRTGKWFGFQHYGINPDIIAIGKGIGNGYPVSVVAVSERIVSTSGFKGCFYSQSHQNDPLGAAVASEVISIITEKKLIQKSRENGKYLKKALKSIDRNKSIIKEVRGRGLMIAIEFKHSAQAVYEELLKRGFIVAKRSNAEVLRIDPALTVEKKTLDFFVKELTEIVSKHF